MSEWLLLLNKQRTFIGKRGIINTHAGAVDITDVQPGDILHVADETFVVSQPTFVDMLLSCKRGAQIITPKDAAQIVAITGVNRGWHCVDGGTGSGFLALFLGYQVGPSGKVTSYEKQGRFVTIARKNVGRCSMEDIIKIKNADITSFTETALNLITLDIKGAEVLVPKARKHLKIGGWLVIYSPHIEQHIKVRNVMENESFIDIKGLETFQREWQSLGGYTRPQTKGLMHTGFLLFGRKLD
jgi:tRNA (adenine57-N1/adenine58-N1)-methyltransferase